MNIKPFESLKRLDYFVGSVWPDDILEVDISTIRGAVMLIVAEIDVVPEGMPEALAVVTGTLAGGDGHDSEVAAFFLCRRSANSDDGHLSRDVDDGGMSHAVLLVR